jgi:ornithine carbamoyltransferase
MLADVLTMREHSQKPLNEIAYAYVGDARSNMGNSLLLIGALLGMDVRIGAPKHLWPSESLIAKAHELAQTSGARVLLTDDPQEAVAGVDFIHTDVWVSMGEPEAAWQERIDLLKPYRVTPELMAASGKPQVKFMHCLPAFHNRETKVGEWIYQTFGLDGVEVTEEVFESEASIVFDQAENRMHTIKAVLVALLA